MKADTNRHYAADHTIPQKLYGDGLSLVQPSSVNNAKSTPRNVTRLFEFHAALR